MDNSYGLLDLTVYGRQERWEDSPIGWPRWPKGGNSYRTQGRPIVQWPGVKVGIRTTSGPIPTFASRCAETFCEC
jgi:hypothetical protein